MTSTIKLLFNPRKLQAINGTLRIDRAKKMSSNICLKLRDLWKFVHIFKLIQTKFLFICIMTAILSYLLLF